jgi:putative ABC transport system substrate-binding protein
MRLLTRICLSLASAHSLAARLLELVHDLVPGATLIAGLINPKNSNAGRNLAALQEAAREKAVQLHIVEASSESDLETAFASLAPLQPGALVVGADPFFNARRQQIVTLAARYSLPAMYEWREFAGCERGFSQPASALRHHVPN